MLDFEFLIFGIVLFGSYIFESFLFLISLAMLSITQFIFFAEVLPEKSLLSFFQSLEIFTCTLVSPLCVYIVAPKNKVFKMEN